MVKLTQEEFEEAIADALDSIPAQLLDAMENVVVLVQDEPEDVQQEFAAAGTEAENGDLLGLYEGTPLTQRGFDYGNCFGDIPDTITIFNDYKVKSNGKLDITRRFYVNGNKMDRDIDKFVFVK